MRENTSKTVMTVANIVTELAVTAEIVLSWIASGKLVAIDVRSEGASRPRWRIPRENFDQFLESRKSRALAPVSRRPRRSSNRTGYTMYFAE